MRRGLRKGGPERSASSGGEKSRSGRRRGLKGQPGRGTLEKEKPPIFGMVQRGGAVILHLLANVQQATIKPLVLAGVASGSLINTDEYAISSRLLEWGFGHKAVGSMWVSGGWAAGPLRGHRARPCRGTWRYARTRRGRDCRAASPARCRGAAAARSATATKPLPSGSRGLRRSRHHPRHEHTHPGRG